MSAGFPRITVRAERQSRELNRTIGSISFLVSVGAGIVLLAAVSITTSCSTFLDGQSKPASDTTNRIQVTSSMPQAVVGTAFSSQVVVTGGTAPYQYSVSGTLPPGLALNATTGLVSGTPTTSGTYNFTIEVTDLNANHGGHQFSLPVAHAATVTVAVSPASGTVASGATQQFTANVSNTSNTAVAWSASAGTISTNGKYTAPAVSANTEVTVIATSAADSSVRSQATLTITAAVTTSPVVINTRGVPSLTQGQAYSTSLSASGGKTPYQWTLVSGSLPSGLELDSSGVISGTTNQTGTFNFAAQVTDSSAPAQTVQASLSLAAKAAYHVKINALFPPMGPGNNMWEDFNTYVLTSPYVDGVNPGLDWNTIETKQGVYDFTSFDASLQHFYDAGKTVNLIIRAVSNGDSNSLTPSYVFSSQWASSLGAPPLDVVTCGSYPGNGHARSGYPVVYELPFKVAYKKFVAAALSHYANNPHIGYIRVGLSVGGEVYPWCSPVLPGFSQTTWLNYVDEMNAYERSLNSSVQLMAALNQVYVSGRWDQSYTTAEARSAVANGQGIGTQGWQQADIANFKAGLPCTSDWCTLFDQYAGQVPLELQQAGDSVANGGTTTGSMADIIPFAAAHHTDILEIYIEDLMTAFDPNWPSYSEYGSSYRQAMVTAHGPKQ
jgi:hypothetical protein